MNDADRFRLLFGPYAPPRFRIGRRLVCAIRGEVVVRGVSDGLIPWPLTRVRGGLTFIIYGSLARAIRREAAIAVAHWWGVELHTVSRWRKALGVSEVNTGTSRLRSRWLAELIPDDRRQDGLGKAWAKAATPEGKAELRARNTARNVSPKQAAALAQGREMARTPEAQKKAGQTRKRLGLRPPLAGRPWTAEELALLGTMPDDELAVRIGRTANAVRIMRTQVGRMTARERQPAAPDSSC